jgi:hypothetical protein
MIFPRRSAGLKRDLINLVLKLTAPFGEALGLFLEF